MIRRLRFPLLAATALAALLHAPPLAAKESRAEKLVREARTEASGVFGFTNLTTLRLTVAREEWALIDPQGRAQPAAKKGAKPRAGLLGQMGVEFDYVHADLLWQGQFFGNVGLRYKGNGTYLASRGSDKRPFKIDFNTYVKGQKGFGLTKLSLNNNVMDPTYVREILSYEIFREERVPAPRTAFAKVYLDVPGEMTNRYLGVYTLVEPVDDQFLNHHYGTKKGLLLKPNFAQELPYLGELWTNYSTQYQPKTDGTPAEQQRFIDFTRLLSRGNDAEFRARIQDYVHVDEFLRFLALHTLLAHLDSFLGMGQNYYLYLQPKTGLIEFIPWDLDLSFGGFMFGGTPQQRMHLSIAHPFSGKNPLAERILAMPELNAIYRDHLRRMLATSCHPDKLNARIEALAAVLRPALAEVGPEEVGRFEAGLTGAGLAEKGTGAGQGRTMGMAPAPALKPFVASRAESIARQLEGKNGGEQIDIRLPGFPQKTDVIDPAATGVRKAE